MAMADRQQRSSERKIFSLCPLWQTSATTNNNSSSSSTQNLNYDDNRHTETVNAKRSKTVTSIARALLPPRHRLRLDPTKNLYFPYEPGFKVRSAIRMKNTSKSHLAFKFQTTEPKTCYMHPPGGILAPGESIIPTVFLYVNPPANNEAQVDLKSKIKFKILSLKVKVMDAEDYVPELFDEQSDQVTVERIWRVVFLDMGRPSPALKKLKRRLVEADAALEACKKPPPDTGPPPETGPPPDTGPRGVGKGLVIDEWKEKRKKYLALQQAGAGDLT